MNFKEWFHGFGEYFIMFIIIGTSIGGIFWGYDGAMIGAMIGNLAGLIAAMFWTREDR